MFSDSSDSHGLVKSHRRTVGRRNSDGSDNDEVMGGAADEDDDDTMFGAFAAQPDLMQQLNAT